MDSKDSETFMAADLGWRFTEKRLQMRCQCSNSLFDAAYHEQPSPGLKTCVSFPKELEHRGPTGSNGRIQGNLVEESRSRACPVGLNDQTPAQLELLHIGERSSTGWIADVRHHAALDAVREAGEHSHCSIPTSQVQEALTGALKAIEQESRARVQGAESESSTGADPGNSLPLECDL